MEEGPCGDPKVRQSDGPSLLAQSSTLSCSFKNPIARSVHEREGPLQFLISPFPRGPVPGKKLDDHDGRHEKRLVRDFGEQLARIVVAILKRNKKTGIQDRHQASTRVSSRSDSISSSQRFVEILALGTRSGKPRGSFARSSSSRLMAWLKLSPGRRWRFSRSYVSLARDTCFVNNPNTMAILLVVFGTASCGHSRPLNRLWASLRNV